MNLLSSIGALGGLAQGAANLVRELRRPQLKSEDFAALMQAELARNQQAPAQEADPAVRAAAFSAEFMAGRDVNADGRLSFSESGLSREVFEKLDADANGALSRDEVRQAYLAQLGVNTNTAESNG